MLLVVPREHAVESPLIDLEAVTLGSDQLLDRAVRLCREPAANGRVRDVQRFLPIRVFAPSFPHVGVIERFEQREVVPVRAQRSAGCEKQR